MKLSEKLFNDSVKNKLILSYEFDKMIFNLNNKTKKSFYQIIDKLCDINNIQYFEEKREDCDLYGKKEFYIYSIDYESKIRKSVKCFKKSKTISGWFGKELLYLLRKEYLKKNIKIEYN